MTRKEYEEKYNRNYTDMLGKPINIGDTVIINSHYSAYPIIGKVSHYTKSGKVAVHRDIKLKKSLIRDWYYRINNTIVVIKHSKRKNDKNI